MKTYDFTVTLAEPSIFEGDALLDYADLLFPYFEGNVTPAVLNGIPVILCHVENRSFEHALGQVLRVLKVVGIEPGKLEMDSDELENLVRAA